MVDGKYESIKNQPGTHTLVNVLGESSILTYLIKSDFVVVISTTDARYNAAAHTVWISKESSLKWWTVCWKKELVIPARPVSWTVRKNASQNVVCDGNQRCCYQQVKPLPNTHRFVRLLLMDAGQGIRYVRPTHRGIIRKPGVFAEGKVRVYGSMYLQVPELASWSRITSCKIAVGFSSVRQGWN